MYLYLYELCGGKAGENEVRRAVLDFRLRTGLASELENDTVCTLEKDELGKPFVREFPDIHVSISHSGDWWACLVGEEPVGVDVEDADRRRNDPEHYAAIARRFFAKDELRFILGGAPDVAKDRFFMVWTMKEAYVKYLGRGLAYGLNKFSAFDPSLNVRIDYMSPWTVLSAGKWPNLHAAFCSPPSLKLQGVVFL